MSILIKGMEMPKNCAECGVEWCERWKGLIIAGMSIAKSRPSNCPFIEVPTPHGRLIDADKLIKLVKAECNPYGKPTIEYEDGLRTLELIADAHVIIEAEEADE